MLVVVAAAMREVVLEQVVRVVAVLEHQPAPELLELSTQAVVVVVVREVLKAVALEALA
jgi:hypothetical protein